MTEQGKYKKIPRPESVKFFLDSTRSHKAVSNVSKVRDYYFRVERIDKPELNVFLTNIYIISEADVYEIKLKYPDVGCIVTISNWNSYTCRAKELCEQNNIGLFVFPEYFGALHYAGEKFVNYESPKRNSK